MEDLCLEVEQITLDWGQKQFLLPKIIAHSQHQAPKSRRVTRLKDEFFSSYDASHMSRVTYFFFQNLTQIRKHLSRKLDNFLD